MKTSNPILKRGVRFIGLIVLLSILVGLVALAMMGVDSWMKKKYIGNQLDCQADWEVLDDCFRSHFQEGVPQDEVHEILLELDPQLNGLLSSELECVGNHCCEIVTPFYEQVGTTFTYVFCYDTDMNFLFMSQGSL